MLQFNSGWPSSKALQGRCKRSLDHNNHICPQKAKMQSIITGHIIDYNGF